MKNVEPAFWGESMERSTELEKHIQEYRTGRIGKKSELLRANHMKLILEFNSKLDILIEEQIKRQNEEGQDKIKHISLSHLSSSNYTESFESYFWMSSSKLYYDEHKSRVYWKPVFLYDGIENDMVEVERLLREKFVRLEAYELFTLKRKLIFDDWTLFETGFYNLVKSCKERLVNSSLQAEDEILILYGNYMEKLQVIGRIGISERRDV